MGGFSDKNQELTLWLAREIPLSLIKVSDATVGTYIWPE